MQKPQGYDESQAFTGESSALPAGAYICKIAQAKEMKSQSGRAMLVLLLDIAEGEFAGYFKEQFDRAMKQNPDSKWRGTFYQLVDGTSLPFFKGMVTSIEESNNFKWDFDETKLKGKLVGAVFGREQYQGGDGKPKWSTKCQAIRSVEAVRSGKVEIPEDKLLPGNTTYSGGFAPSTPLPDDGDLPF